MNSIKRERKIMGRIDMTSNFAMRAGRVYQKAARKWVNASRKSLCPADLEAITKSMDRHQAALERLEKGNLSEATTIALCESENDKLAKAVATARSKKKPTGGGRGRGQSDNRGRDIDD